MSTIARVAGAVVLGLLVGSAIADRRGWVLGALAFLMYGSLAVAPFAVVRRWSAGHVVLDSLVLVPLVFFALLLIPALAWWVAAFIALGAGALFVPLMVRRRTAAMAERGPRR